jgi:hypothetical protein
MSKFDEKNATADEIAAYKLGRQEAADEAEGVPKTVADIHAMTREQVMRHKKTVDKILREQPPMSRREAARINAENE